MGALPHVGFFHQDLQVGGAWRRLGPQGGDPPSSAQADRQKGYQASRQPGGAWAGRPDSVPSFGPLFAWLIETSLDQGHDCRSVLDALLRH